MQNDSQLDKFILFKIADYLLALPINNVLKVINFSTGDCKKLSKMGLVQIGKYIVKVLDLHHQLNSHALPNSFDYLPFMVVAHNSQGELYGISIDEPPDLVELPPETIRLLPRSSNHNKLITEIVSHVVILSEKEDTQTIFLLDLERVAQPV